MKNQILKIGKTLSKIEQKNILGGREYFTVVGDHCYDRYEGKAPSNCPCTLDVDCASTRCGFNGLCG